MKASELMIGNWVKCGRRCMKVTQLAEDIDCDDIEPIPLTPEILEKNGFRHGCYVGGYYSPDCPFRVFTKTEGTCGFTTLFDDEIHFSCIFVHQLQNALSLCGIEKEITI